MLLKRKISLFLLCFTALWQVLFSQQQSNSTQFFWNQFLINPAYTGTLHYNPIQLGYRKQWQNFNGSPETFTFGGHAALNKNMGIGGMVIKDNMGGAFSQTAFNTQFSYRIHFGIGNFISAGATALLNQVVFDNSKITTLNSNDPTFQGTVQKSTAPDFSFGLLLQLKHHFQFGLSSQQITQGKLSSFNTVPGEVNTLLRQYNAQLAYRYGVSKNVTIETSALLKTTDIKLMQADVNLKAWYQNMVMLGAAYRNDDAVSILAAFKYKKIFFAYSFDITTSTIRAYQNGTHEIIIGYHFQNRHNPPPDTSFKKKSGRKFIAQVLLSNNKPVDHLKLFLVDKNGSVQDSATTNNKGKFLFYLLDSINNYMIDAEELNNDFSDKKYKIVKDKKVIAVSTSLNGKHRFNFRPLDAEKPILNEQKEEEGNFEAFVFYQKKNEPVDHLKLMLLDKYGKTIDSTFTDVLGKFKFTHVDSIKNFSIEASEDQAELSDKKYKMVKDGKTIAVSTPFNGKHRFNFRPLEAEQPKLVVEEVKEDDFIAFVYYQNNDKAIEQLKLFLLDKYGMVKDSSTTDKSGKFKFRHLDNISNYLIEADDKDGALQNKKYKIVKDGKVIAESVPFNGKHRFNFKPLEAEQPKLDVEEINDDDFTAFVYYQYNDKAVEQLKLLLLDKYGAVKDSAITDKSGKFKFRHLENIGNYLIEADDKDGALQNKKYIIVKDGKVIAESIPFNGKHRFDFKRLIADKPKLEEMEVSDESFDLTLKEKKIEGQLTSKNTLMVNKVKVYLVDEKGNKLDSAYTDAKGKFEFKKLPNATKYLVEVDENDDQLKNIDFNLKLDGKPMQLSKTIDGKKRFKLLDTDGPILKDEKINETTLDGIVFAKNNTTINNVKVYLLDKKGNKIDSAYTNSKGKFEFKRLDNVANYLIEVDELDTRIKDQLFSVKQNGKQLQFTTLLNGKKVIDPLKADAPILKDEKINETTLDGIVFAKNNTTINNVKVYLIDKNGNKVDSAYTNSKGKFEFKQLDNVANYLIEVDEQDTRIKDQIFSVKQNGKQLQFTTLLNGKKVFDPLKAEVPILKDEKINETTLDGIVFAKNNTTINNVKVYLLDKKGNKVDSAYSNSKGKFEFKQLDNVANYLIEVDEQDTRIKDQLFSVKQNGKQLQFTTLLNGKKVIDPLKAEAIKLDDEKINDTSINGQLFSAYYKIIANAKVYLVDKNGNKVDSAYTDSKGKFNFRQLDKTTNYLIEVDEQDTRIKNQVFILKQNSKTNVVKKAKDETRIINTIIEDKKENKSSVSKNSIPDFVAMQSNDDDNDGIINHDDLCPHLPGDKENKGCPVLTKAHLDAIAKAIHEIEFETNSTNITKESYPAIDSLVSILNSDTHLKLRITGHTDANGGDLFNVELSKNRAESIKKFFLQRGVYESRMELEYYGETKPLNPNDTEEGRKKNRRVEFLFIFD